MTMKIRRRKQLVRCGRTGLVILVDEIEAKLVLAERQRKDTGEIRYFECGNHFHLTSLEKNEGVAAASE